MDALFRDRAHAGHLLAERLAGMALDAPVVFALPRGGVPVADAIADALKAPLDVLFVRKIGTPWQPELALAAVVDGDSPTTVVNEELARNDPVDPDFLAEGVKRELAEIERRRRLYLDGRPPVDVRGRTAIVVDDGLATGTTARAALQALRRRDPARLLLAVPVAPASTLRELRPLVDELVCLASPAFFVAVGQHYDDFHQLDDDEVIALLRKR
jgi:putative phosphoribosyl transferase